MHSILIYLTKTAENKLNKFVLENLTQLVLLDCIVQISRMIISISESAFISQYFPHKKLHWKNKIWQNSEYALCVIDAVFIYWKFGHLYALEMYYTTHNIKDPTFNLDIKLPA